MVNGTKSANWRAKDRMNERAKTSLSVSSKIKFHLLPQFVTITGKAWSGGSLHGEFLAGSSTELMESELMKFS